ncbi:MAG: helix-turn-helix domain-containing protein, partial [Alphaproteobacteria bacterium]
ATPGDERGLDDWSRRAGASERTLARLFLAETGFTFGAWRQRLRLLAAMTRLAAGEPVTTVALDLGYANPSAFTAMFRRHMGAAPTRYLRA